jgi:hypothetical protein
MIQPSNLGGYDDYTRARRSKAVNLNIMRMQPADADADAFEVHEAAVPPATGERRHCYPGFLKDKHHQSAPLFRLRIEMLLKEGR